MYEFGNLIAGEWVAGRSESFVTRNPARPAEIVGRYTAASAEQVNAAIAAAHDPVWSKNPSARFYGNPEIFNVQRMIGAA